MYIILGSFVSIRSIFNSKFHHNIIQKGRNMKSNKVKSFTFKVAEKSQQSDKQFKAREGVAVAGCTMTTTPWGREPTTSWFGQSGDGGMWC
jgi:hypothetical protein